MDDPAADRAAFPRADLIITDDYDLSKPSIGSHTFIVIAPNIRAITSRFRKRSKSKAPYIALISSRYRARLVLDYLAATGISPEQLERVWAPAELDIGAATPDEESATTLIRECHAGLPENSHSG